MLLRNCAPSITREGENIFAETKPSRNESTKLRRSTDNMIQRKPIQRFDKWTKFEKFVQVNSRPVAHWMMLKLCI
jgi:hypothetical protein